MKQTIVWALVVANVALAGTLAWRGIRENTAVAQPVPPAGAAEPGKYIMIPGDSQIGVSVVYVFDSTNKRLGAIAPDAKDMLSPLSSVSIARVFEAGGTGVQPVGEDRNNNGGNNRNRPRP